MLYVSAGTDQSLSGAAPPLLVTVVTPASTGTNHPPAVALSTPAGRLTSSSRRPSRWSPTWPTPIRGPRQPGGVHLGATRLAVTPTNSGQRYQFQTALSAGTSSTFTVRVHDSHGGLGISNPLTFTIR
ncbi:hypothetical protein NKG94_22850 [Micromonospora sp. M12]